MGGLCQGLGAGALLRGPYRPYRSLDRIRGVRGDRRRTGDRGSQLIAVRREFADQARLVRPPGRDAFRRAHQCHPGDLPERHPLGEVDGLVRADHPVRRVRVEERRRFARDDELRLAQQVERPAAGHPAHRGDHRLPQVVGLRADGDHRVVDGVRGRRLRHRHRAVDPRAEGPGARAGDDGRTYRVVEAQLLQTVESSTAVVRSMAFSRSGRSMVTTATPVPVSRSTRRLMTAPVAGAAPSRRS